MKIKQILDEISEAKGNDKMTVLEKYDDNDLLKQVLYLAKSNRIKFYIKNIPKYTMTEVPILKLEHGIAMLEDIYQRRVTGGQAIDLLITILSELPDADAYVIKRIIDKDLKFGLGVTGINKVIPKLIEVESYQGAKSYSKEYAEKIMAKGNAVSQLKADGSYLNAKIVHGDVETVSRSGERVVLTGSKVMMELQSLIIDNVVFNGELTMIGVPERRIANGIILSVSDILSKVDDRTEAETDKRITALLNEHLDLNGKTFQEVLDSIVYNVWDIISIEGYHAGKYDRSYSDRLMRLTTITQQSGFTNIQLIESRFVSTMPEAMAHFQEKLAEGLEGTILKDLDAPWKNGKKSSEVKMKLIIEVDLKIVGFEYGTKGTKNESVISTLNVESSCGLVKVSPSGLTEKEMMYVTGNMDNLLGTIVSVKSCGLSQNSSGQRSMLHPSVVEFRTDKHTADSYEDIQLIEDSAKGLVAN